jgi:accessory gene regulator B
MSLIQVLSSKSAKWLVKKVPNTQYDAVEDQIEVYSYGFQVLWGMVFKGLLLVGLSWLLGVLKEAIIITITFSSFRIIAGGYHMQSYLRCISISLFQFILSGLIIKYTHPYWTNINVLLTLLLITILSMLYVIIKYIPRDNPNKKITNHEEIMKFKRWSLYYLVGWTLIMMVSLWLNINTLVIASCLGLLLEVFSITNLGYAYIYPLFDEKRKYSL